MPARGSRLIATPSGPVYGALVTTSAAVRYTVPYAQPPVGKLRFADPIKVTGWSTPLNASTLPRPCPQSSDPATSSTIEDCLCVASAMAPLTSQVHEHLRADVGDRLEPLARLRLGGALASHDLV